MLGQTFRGFIFHINLRTLPQQPRGYTAGTGRSTAPTTARTAPHLPNPPVPYYPTAGQFPNLNDGANNIGKGDNQRTATGLRRTPPGNGRAMSSSVAGFAGQKALVNSLTAPVLGVPVSQMSDVATLLFAPVLSGSEVSVR